MEVVPLRKPDEADEIVAALGKMIERVRGGEFETIVIIGFAPSGSWIVKEVGKHKSNLEKIGMLECLKADYIQSTDLDLPSGL